MKECNKPGGCPEVESVVYIGKKPVMTYVTSCIILLNTKNKVTIKARGRNTSKAIDTAEIVRKRFVQDTKITDIKIDTEEVEAEGRTLNVSTIEIKLSKT